MTFKDPLQVRYYEKKLGRKLSEAEVNGQVPVQIGRHSIYLEINEIVFPYDLMSRTDLFSLVGKVGKARG